MNLVGEFLTEAHQLEFHKQPNKTIGKVILKTEDPHQMEIHI